MNAICSWLTWRLSGVYPCCTFQVTTRKRIEVGTGAEGVGSGAGAAGAPGVVDPVVGPVGGLGASPPQVSRRQASTALHEVAKCRRAERPIQQAGAIPMPA